jgi:hypothetical protein
VDQPRWLVYPIQALRDQIVSFAKELRNFDGNLRQHDYEQEIADSNSIRSLPRDQQATEWNRQVNASVQRKINEETDVKNRYFVQAQEYEQELLRRLGISTPQRPERASVLAYNGSMAGVSPISELADYLEGLARRL